MVVHLIRTVTGYWTSEKDYVFWDFKSRWAGTYAVHVLQGCGKGQGGSEVEVAVNGQSITFVVEETGGVQAFEDRVIGEVKLPATGSHTLVVRPKVRARRSVMDLRQVRLVPMGK